MRSSASASLIERVGERLGVAGRHRLRRADQRVEHGRVVQVLLVVVLGGRVAAALLGEHVDEDRALLGQLDRVAERVLHLLDVVAVERADVAHAERLEERRRLEELAHARLERIHRRLGLVPDDRQVPRNSSRRRWRRTYTGLVRMSVSACDSLSVTRSVTLGWFACSSRPCALADSIDTVGAYERPLSLRTMMTCLSPWPMLLIAS
jgi:hypothetical protein